MAAFGSQQARRRLSTLLIAAGLVLLGYVALQYGQMWWAQRQLAEEWQRQSQITELPGETTHPQKRESQTPQESSPGVTRLRVPSISLDAMVVEGTSNKALALGPGHISSTAVPGERGNAAISGHRDTFFRRIHELNIGDEVLVQRSGHTFRFEVTGKKIVQPTDVWVLNPTPDHQLTLITCYPTYYVGPAPERLVVFSKMIEESEAQQTSERRVPMPKAGGAAAGGSR